MMEWLCVTVYVWLPWTMELPVRPSLADAYYTECLVGKDMMTLMGVCACGRRENPFTSCLCNRHEHRGYSVQTATAQWRLTKDGMKYVEYSQYWECFTWKGTGTPHEKELKYVMAICTVTSQLRRAQPTKQSDALNQLYTKEQTDSIAKIL